MKSETNKKHSLRFIIVGFLFCLGSSLISTGFANEDSFLQHLKRTYLVTNSTTPFQAFIQKVLKEGSVQQSGTDKEMRSTFIEFQALMEQEMLKELIKPQFGRISKHIRSFWIIHTPLIATPLVTQGEVSRNLISPRVMADKDKKRVQTSLARAALIREYLANGGVLIATYVVSNSGPMPGRTPEQMTIFKELKQQYPQQLIELPLPMSMLPAGKFPEDKLGATYIVQQPSGYIFEMTNMGTQINDARDGAKWGVWLQERHLPQGQTTQRLCSVFAFLAKANLKEVLRQHALAHQQKPQVYFTLLAPYLVDKKNPRNVPSLLCGEMEV